jgi:arabinofuranan 3-O-arabinosyltransferase
VTGTGLLRKPRTGASAGRFAAWRRGVPRLRLRLRLLACCLFLAAVPFATAPGDIIADTKFELAVNPAGFLSGALTLWNPQQFGVLLNQAVGYLFPMGPFFALLRLVGADGWIVQRLWLSALLIAAFGGTVRLAARMGAGTPGTRLAGGLAYALSPMALSMLGQTSGEFLPMALMPWIIVPLADLRPWLTGGGTHGDGTHGDGARGGEDTPRPGRHRGTVSRARAVARSAVAVGLCSGMNAASTIAVLLPVVGYILTRPGARTKVRMLAWWAPAALLVTSAWSIPLVLLSRYGVSIVPFTESAQVTASTTSLLDVLRGTENWIGYQATNGQPDRPLAFLIATGVLPGVLTGLLAALGLAGLAHREIPERRFLLWSALGGVVIISLGYVSSLGNPVEGPLIGLINGPASPFRNLWKFDPMIRLPLAIGLAHLLAAPWTARARAALGAVAAIALASLAVPALSTGLASPGSFSQVPAYWAAAAGWLTAHAGSQAVLVEPGAAFGEYTWGSPMDDVLAGLTNVDWAGRNLETVGSVGNERLLDAIDQQFAAGDGSAGLTAVLARMGVKYVLVRNDLSRAALDGTWPARIHDTIAASGGMTLAAQFGPAAGGGTPDDAVADFDPPYPAVQIYRVAGAQPTAVVQPAAGTLRVYGAPEAMITLANEGLLGDRPVLINDDGAGEPVTGSVVTDSLRRRTVNFGELRTNYSPTLTAGQSADTFLSTDDYTEPDWSEYLTVARYAGIGNVTASSSASDITANSAQWATGTLPYAAFDGNAATLWESGAFNGPFGQWIEGFFEKNVRFTGGSAIQVAFADNLAIGPPVTKVEVTTAAGQVTDPVRITGDLQPLRVPAGASGWLRITITGLDTSPGVPLLGTQVGIVGINVPGVSASRTVVAPPVAGGDPSAVVLAKAAPYQSSCMLTSVRWVCSPQLSDTTEEQYGFDHAFGESHSEQAVLFGSARLTDPSLADDYALPVGDQPVVTASSTYTGDPQDQPGSAFDGNTATAWIASPADPQPKLTISWGYSRAISRITIERPPGASGLAQVLITGSRGQRRGAMVAADGVVSFAPMKTASLSLTFTTDQAPLQISDVLIGGVRHIRTPAVSFRLPCGLGPQLTVDGQTIPTGVTGTFADLANGSPMRFTACLAVTLTAGTDRVTESATDPFDVRDVVLETAGTSGMSAGLGTGGAAPTAATVLSWTSSLRTLRVAAATRSYLEVNENFNAGWRAVLGGRQLRPVRLDGWKQAWVLPAGTTGVVTLAYRPESLYRDAVIGGLAALALVIAVALAVPRRRPRRPLAWSAQSLMPGGRGRRPRQDRAQWRWLTVGSTGACLAAAGLVLGGYPGAVLLPAVVAVFCFPPRGRRAASDPRLRSRLLGGLLAVALVVGAVGEHLVLSGHTGPFVTATANTIPQVICLIIVGGLAAALLDARAEQQE